MNVDYIEGGSIDPLSNKLTSSHYRRLPKFMESELGAVGMGCVGVCC